MAITDEIREVSPSKEGLTSEGVSRARTVRETMSIGIETAGLMNRFCYSHNATKSAVVELALVLLLDHHDWEKIAEELERRGWGKRRLGL